MQPSRQGATSGKLFNRRRRLARARVAPSIKWRKPVPTIETTPDLLTGIYARMESNLSIVRDRLKRPLTLAEKILFSHLDDPHNQEIEAGKAYLLLRPDRVALQDATAQMALLQFMQAGKPEVAVPTTVHCDHLIQARTGAAADTEAAINENREVYDFLSSVCAKYGAGFWKPGSGIIHQVVLENYAFPGGLMIGTDSHTPNAGGLGMAACGVGGADAVDVMAGFPWEVLQPKVVGVKLKGEMNGWTAPKDIILYILGKLTVKGGTNRIIEYFGPGARTISATGKATICNMGAELGATCSVFPFDERMEVYQGATGRAALATIAKDYAAMLAADPEVEANPGAYYDEVIEIDLSALEPHIVGPHTPDLARPVSELAKEARENGYPLNLTSSLIGSCTNSSYEDIGRAADIARQAVAAGSKMKTPLLISPGSDQIFETIKRDGQMADLEAVGAVVMSNACGPCIGQWKRTDIEKGVKNSIITSFNRNFRARNDSNPETFAFISSPEIVMAFGLAGTLDINPLKDELTTEDGKKWKLQAPAKAPEIPAEGFKTAFDGYLAPAKDGSNVKVEVAPDSNRLQLLSPFAPHKAEDFNQMPLLVKTKGKTTTDHISPAGPWLRFRGHLDKISDNMFTGANNAFTGEAGKTLNQLTGEKGLDIPAVARAYKAQGLKWVVVGDENYGEGSSREHAAMSPRFLNGGAVITRSFARIHESNLKKQGVLPFTFADSADYEKVQEMDKITLEGLEQLAPGSQVFAVLLHADGSTDKVALKHTLNAEQITWFRAGSALNLLRQQGEKAGATA
ncbi:aconitate hydratase [bacterium]|nr:aconitate hydratase [bacterium]